MSIRFTPEQLEKVARLAEIEDRSQSSVVRRAVDALDDAEVQTRARDAVRQER
jgi:predicted transcriptional regulator